jgi:hypothetical protein
MSDALDSLSSSPDIPCHYVNTTGRLQIIRIENIPNWYFERVIFPGQSLIFHAFPESLLEVHSYELATAILVDRIPCMQIRCTESVDLTQVVQRKHQSSLKAA